MMQKSLFSLALAFALTSLSVQADPFPMPLKGPPRGVLPVSTGVTNGNITFSWAAQFGKWELLEQPVVGPGDWKSVAAAQYQTNGSNVSVTLPLPEKTAFYCVRRSFNLRPPPFPKNLPQVPPRPTNAPPRFKRPS